VRAALAPENSIPGFAFALGVGVNTIELDAGVTKDGVVVGNLAGQIGLDAARDIDLSQFFPLEHRVVHQLALLTREVGVLGIGLRTDRNILAGRHRHRAGDQPATPVSSTSLCEAAADATPRIRLAVEIIPSLAPSHRRP